ncbi:Uncharacterized protein TCAP_06562 [Tolypocladium capitatum]|uniref:DNA polymerase delta subunit 3 n=1 Tax=Tolypocladium capitatum TaxID=45235 RepID=A0A2K3Q7E7_9HYPO|nr:Uncharacterized protein TCAP_06562 [Tolypocladium capitatum]
MDEHQKFLADRLLSEERPITYRLLSRALDLHVNTAKRMLYDFHKYQNALRADSIHATYLVYGAKSAKSKQQNGDVRMSSSMPEPGPLSEAISTKTLTLVGEQNLQDLLAEYQEVTSLHIYSLAPHSQSDQAVLAEISSSISEYPKEQDPAAAANKYGTILNPNVRRRNRGGRPAVQAATTSEPIKPEPAMVKPAQAPKVKQEAAETPFKGATPSSSRKTAASTTKRGGPGGIMQSFAKAASKPPPKPKQAAKREGDGDGTMALSDDGDADDSDMPPSKRATKDADTARKSRKEREEELRRMMEEDGNEDEPGEKDSEPDDEEMAEASKSEPEPEPEPEPEAEAEPDSMSKEHEEPTEEVSSSGDGRRRGKRRVMKKRRILDDQGYMVTIQEAGWESFSEDEASQPPAKKATLTSTPSSSGSKVKKAAGKTGQGNIMSFFSKK